MEYGLEILKFFPAEASGGINMIKSLSGPYGKIKFIPTGGINISNLGDYLELKAVHACGGSWMVSPKLISEGRFDEITRLAKEAVATVLGFDMDGTKGKIILGCNSIDRSLSFFKRRSITVDYNEVKKEISLAQPAVDFQIVLRDKRSSDLTNRNAKMIAK